MNAYQLVRKLIRNNGIYAITNDAKELTIKFAEERIKEAENEISSLLSSSKKLVWLAKRKKITKNDILLGIKYHSSPSEEVDRLKYLLERLKTRVNPDNQRVLINDIKDELKKLEKKLEEKTEEIKGDITKNREVSQMFNILTPAQVNNPEKTMKRVIKNWEDQEYNLIEIAEYFENLRIAINDQIKNKVLLNPSGLTKLLGYVKKTLKYTGNAIAEGITGAAFWEGVKEIIKNV